MKKKNGKLMDFRWCVCLCVCVVIGEVEWDEFDVCGLSSGLSDWDMM